MKTNILIFCICLCAPTAFGQTEVMGALSDRVANYNIDVLLDTSNKMLHASQEVFFRNPSSDTIHDMQFHLYYNAFKNSNSSFFEENTFPFSQDSDENQCNWSWTEITKIIDDQKNDLSNNWKYIQPDDDNIKDQTVLLLDLAEPILPFDSIKLNVNWTAKIPKIMARTGYNKEFYFFAQWFPKLGVYEPAGMRYAEVGGWNCHQYHANGEYYADFGNYKVAMTVPNDFVIAASGELINKVVSEKGTTWLFGVNDVIDFTWTASPHYKIQTTTYKNTKIQLYTYPTKTHFAERYFKTIEFAFSFMDEKIGTYPYSTLSIIDVPIHGIFTGGMEYPTLISTIGFCFIPVGIKTPETLIVHEFIHQYFMQMVATNEQEEAWMDEGLTTYFESRILDELDGEQKSTVDWLGIEAGNKAFNRAEFFSKSNIKIAEASRFSRDFVDGGYNYISYNKTALWLQTLEGLVGQDMIDRIFRTYFDQWKFKHPCKTDFIDVVNEVTGQNWDWFFSQVLDGTVECDYKLHKIKNHTITADEGFYSNLEQCEVLDDKLIHTYESSITIHRLGEMTLPQEIQIHFEDGSTRMESWDGMSRTKTYTYRGNQPVVKAVVDPERKIFIDKNFANNSIVVQQNTTRSKRFTIRLMNSLQQMLSSLTLLV